MERCRMGRIVAALGVFALSGSAVFADFALKTGDRVVIFGDSAVAEVRAVEYLDQFLRTKYPDRAPLVCALGERDCSAMEGLDRLPREVFPLNPTHVLLCFGIDGPEKKRFDQARLDRHIETLTKMIDACREKNIKVELVTPPPPDQKQSRGLNSMKFNDIVAQYAEAIRNLAKEKSLPVVEWHEGALAWLRAYSGKNRPGWTRNGILPNWYCYAMLTDVLLKHWSADPFDYEIKADWKAGTASANVGSVKVVNHGEKKLELALEDVPTVVNMLGGTRMEEADWPLSNWFRFRLKVDNALPRSIMVADDVEQSTVLAAGELAEGVDISTSGPLANHPATLKLHDAILRKCNQFAQHRTTANTLSPEPELDEGFELLHAAQRTLADGAFKIAYRMPSRFNATVRFEDVFESEKMKQNQKKPRGGRRGMRPPPRGRKR